MVTADVLVIGAGVSGLTTAVCLAEAGRNVRIVAERLPKATTSAVAGASWGPYMVEDQRVLYWSSVTRRALEQIATWGSTGVRLVNGLEASEEPMDPPGWATEVSDFRLCRPDELPARYASGWRYTIPLVEMPMYLGYLEERLASAGGEIAVGTIGSFAEVAEKARALVNCTGLGARTLVPDDGVFAVRGQLVVVTNPGVDWFFQDNADGEELTYFLPHDGHVVLGGSAVEDSRDELPDPDVAQRIIDRCAKIEPRLRHAEIIDNRVGLRPTRAHVRVERGEVEGVPIVHNYGHGGAGLTLSWGCAQEVVRLLG